MVTDYYAILNLPADASPDDVKKAYRKMALRWHPDKNTGSKKVEAERRFKQIGEAYQVLSDPSGRRRYDQGYKQQQQQHKNHDSGGAESASNHTEARSFHFSGSGFAFRDPEEVFREFFGAGDGGNDSWDPFSEACWKEFGVGMSDWDATTQHQQRTVVTESTTNVLITGTGGVKSTTMTVTREATISRGNSQGGKGTTTTTNCRVTKQHQQFNRAVWEA